MDIKPIRDDNAHRAALVEIEAAWAAAPGSREADRLDVLATLVADYEQRRFPIDSPDPIEAIRFRMDQMGLTAKDLEPYIGSRGRLSEVLSRRRGLSLSMIRRLHEGLGIPADVLIQVGPWIAEIADLDITVTGSTRAEAAANAELARAGVVGRRRLAHTIQIIHASAMAQARAPRSSSTSTASRKPAV